MYSINVIFYNIKILDDAYSKKNFDHQNEPKTGPKCKNYTNTIRQKPDSCL